MQFKINVDGKVLTVYLQGELDLSIADELRQQLDTRLDETGINNLIFDMDGVNFIDSSILGVMLGRYKRLSSKGGKVMITSARSQIRRILEMSGLFRIMEEYPTADEALAKIV